MFGFSGHDVKQIENPMIKQVMLPEMSCSPGVYAKEVFKK